MDILEYSLKLGEEAYQQEKNRESLIRERTNYVFKWITLLASIFNIAVPLIVKETDINEKAVPFIVLYLLMMLLIVVEILLIISIEFPKKQKYYPLGTEVLKKGKGEEEQYTNDVVVQYKCLINRDVLTKQLSQNNDEAVRRLKGIYYILAAIIILMAIFFTYIVLQ